MERKPLHGLRILDLTQFLSGPFCTLILCDLGAEIIKIERPVIGDSTRTDTPTRMGTSAMYISCNRGKKSVVLDLKNPEHKQIFLDLVQKSDVVVENFKPGTMKKLGLSYEELSTVKKDIIYLAISGYGQTGPYSSRGALDIAIQAMSGFMSITGPKGGKPTKAGSSLADIVSGFYGAIGIMAAIMHRLQTGEGQFIDVAMLDSMTASIMQNSIARYFLNGVIPVPQGNRHPASAPFQEFQTKDGCMMICCPTNTQFKSLMEGLGHIEIYEDDMFHDTEMRYSHKDELESVLSPIFAQWTTEELADMMEKRGLAFGEINTVKDVAENVQVKSRRMIVEVEDSTAGTFQTIGSPIKMSCLGEQTSYHSPELGENTTEILEKVLGLKQEIIESLFASYGIK